MAAMTLTEKICARAAGKREVRAGDMLAILKKEGTSKNFAGGLASLQDYEELLDLSRYLGMEKRFAAD
jgi:hypothetical protein